MKMFIYVTVRNFTAISMIKNRLYYFASYHIKLNFLINKNDLFITMELNKYT